MECGGAAQAAPGSHGRAGGLNEVSMNKPPPSSPPLSALHLDNIQAFLGGTRGTITLGHIAPIPYAAIAAEGKKLRAALVGGEEETVAQLLRRLDAALEHFADTGELVDEVLAEIKRRRAQR